MFLTSDGFTDQNNAERKRFGKKRMFRTIQSNINKTMEIQKLKLEEELDNWQAGQQQRDDITIMGVKL